MDRPKLFVLFLATCSMYRDQECVYPCVVEQRTVQFFLIVLVVGDIVLVLVALREELWEMIGNKKHCSNGSVYFLNFLNGLQQFNSYLYWYLMTRFGAYSIF